MNTLSNALPIVAAAYGRRFGIAVQVGNLVADIAVAALDPRIRLSG